MHVAVRSGGASRDHTTARRGSAGSAPPLPSHEALRAVVFSLLAEVADDCVSLLALRRAAEHRLDLPTGSLDDRKGECRALAQAFATAAF